MYVAIYNYINTVSGHIQLLFSLNNCLRDGAFSGSLAIYKKAVEEYFE